MRISKVDIPSAPLWHMIRAGRGDSESAKVLQSAIDFLTCKTKHGLEFDEDDKEFLVELFEALYWGGKYKHWPEAAELADHYVNGDGKEKVLGADVYKTSAIVSDMMVAMKEYIAAQVRAGRQFSPLVSDDPGLLKAPQIQRLFKGKRNATTQGYFNEKLKIIVTEQSNQRLKNADNRFSLKATSTRNNVDVDVVETWWMVDSLYDFEPFDHSSKSLTENDKRHMTHLPLEGGTIKLPDGLSHHMTLIGVAKDFRYYSKWLEHWRLSSVRK